MGDTLVWTEDGAVYRIESALGRDATLDPCRVDALREPHAARRCIRSIHHVLGVSPMHRLRLALPFAVLASLLLAMPALAGGWASVIPDEGSISGVEPGVPHDVSVTLLQHGVTPVRDGSVRFTLTDATTGAAVVATAHHVGAGVWEASVTVPAAGSWSLEATHSDLALQATTPIVVAVAPVPAPCRGRRSAARHRARSPPSHRAGRHGPRCRCAGPARSPARRAGRAVGLIHISPSRPPAGGSLPEADVAGAGSGC